MSYHVIKDSADLAKLECNRDKTNLTFVKDYILFKKKICISVPKWSWFYVTDFKVKTCLQNTQISYKVRQITLCFSISITAAPKVIH